MSEPSKRLRRARAMAIKAELTHEGVFQVIKSFLVSKTKIEPEDISPESNFNADLGVDSLEAIEIVMMAEETFGIDIPDDHVSQLLTVDLLVRYILYRSVPFAQNDPIIYNPLGASHIGKLLA